MERKKKLPGTAQTTVQAFGPALGTVLFFFAVCLSSAATVRVMAMQMVLLTLAAAFLFWGRLRDRIKPPILLLSLVVLMNLASSLYAVSGKFALYELLKIMTAFCLALLLLAFLGADRPERGVAIILEGFAAISGLVSIDLLSTRWISTPVLTALGWFTTDYADLGVVEEGIRMTSIFLNPNVFAGCMGIGVLLSLGLAVHTEKPKNRIPHLICLSINALAFVLAFSMGACLSILPAFLALLLLTEKSHRTGLLVLMVETLATTVLAAFPISLTSMTAWTGFRPIPLLCTAGSAAALCALDLLAGRRLASKLDGHRRALLCFAAALLVTAVVFAIVACSLTAGITLREGESLRRAAYPEAGTYAVAAEGSGDPSVVIQSQNRADTMMHTSSELYSGPLSQAVFTVPEDSLVVWFQFRAEGEARLDTVGYSGENGSGSIPLGYRVLPSFVANRIQGLRANQNAIQRFVFFEDGLKLFLRSPVIGLGLGAFENGVRSVQTFRYDTKYAHNHYIQTMAETGMIGLILFLALLAVSALAIWRGQKKPLAPALGGALVFIAAHGMVEFTLSTYCYLPMAFGVIAAISLCCGDDIPCPAWMEKAAVRNGLALGVCAMLVVFEVLLGCNAAAANMVDRSAGLETLEQAAALDPFEKADYMLTYVVQVTGTQPEDGIRKKADQYASRLEKLDSNIIPYHLAEYYLDSGRTEKGLEMAERYVTYVASDLVAWQNTFELLELYEQDTPEYRAGVACIAELLDAWNEENLGHIELDEQYRLFIDRMRA